MEDEDSQDGTQPQLGPNPKIRNMSRAYREAKGDIVWILDCNVWVDRGTLGHMVDRLCGYSLKGQVRPYKLVHQIPIVVDVGNNNSVPNLTGHPVQASYDDQSHHIPDIFDAADTILLCVSHQNTLVDDILSFSKLDSMMLSLVPRGK